MIESIIKRPVFVAMLLIGLSLLGIISYTQLPLELFPYIDSSMFIVSINGPNNADPGYVEREGVIPMESAIAALDDIERIESSISKQQATIFVTYKAKSNPKYAYLKLQECVDTNQTQMGENFSASVQKSNPDQLSDQFISFQARGAGSLDQIRQVADEKIVPDLEMIDGIANVEIYGGQKHSIEIIVDEDELNEYDLTFARVSSLISQGVQDRQYLGQVIEGSRKFFVNLESKYTSLKDIENIVIREQGPILLKHIATIVDGVAEEESISRINGMESVTISLFRNREANLLSLSRQTRKIIDDLNHAVESDGINLVIQQDAALEIEENIDTILLLALVGSILAVAVLFFFLRNLSLVLIVALTIPTSVLISMNLFYALGITINTLSLVGVAIAIGMLLDNSIVVLENIHRHLAQKEDVLKAVVRGTNEVARAIVAATLTTICIFLPFAFSAFQELKILGWQVGVSIISTLLVSLAVAFLLIPAFSYRYLSRKNRSAEAFSAVDKNNRLKQIYNVLLKSCLRFPAQTLLIGFVAFFISIYLCFTLSINVPREIELDNFFLYGTFPSGTTLETADNQVKEMDVHMQEFTEIEERLAAIKEDNVVFNLKLSESFKKKSGSSLDALREAVFETLEEAFRQVEFSTEEPEQNVPGRGSGGGGSQGNSFNQILGIGSSQERIVIHGQDLDLMRDIADDIEYNISELDFVSRTGVSTLALSPSIDLLLDKPAMSHFDVSLQSFQSEIANFQQEFSSGVTQKQGTEEVDIILKNKEEAEGEKKEKTSEDLRGINIPSTSGGTIPILQLSELVYSRGYYRINRINQEKQVSVSYQFESDIEDSKQFLEAARTSIEQIVAGISPPPGILIEVQHAENDLSEFYYLILVGILLIYMVLASTFESLSIPFAMMLTLPLAAVGAFWGLIFTGNSLFNANALIGLFILLGVVVNNGIILIDYSRLLEKRNYRTTRALLTSGLARVRPILITALTTILAMLPIALGKSAYVSAIGAPFAITVIGGLSVGTLFTLLLVPTVSFGLQNALKWWKDLSWKIKALQGLVFAAGCSIIFSLVYSFPWRVAISFILFLVIPSVTYFFQTSLRRTHADLIAQGLPITITIRNITKLYDDHSRFSKEWRKGKKDKQHSLNKNLIWQIPLYIFLFTFTYFYLSRGFWILFFSLILYISTLSLVRGRLGSLLYKIVYWGLPVPNLWFFHSQWGQWQPVWAIAFMWYFCLFIYSTSQKLSREKIDIMRLKGRFRRARKFYYRLVKNMPLLGKQRTPFRALDQVSLKIESGMFGLVGPNGAGKTTLMRVICGILPPTRGKVFFNEIDLNAKREELQSLIGYLPQEFGTYENMTAFQFLDYQAMLKGIWNAAKRQKAVEHSIRSVHLEDNRDIKIKNFSGGMKQRVGIAQTLLRLPRVLIVDEPTAGLDPRERIRFRNLLSELSKDRVVIFSTHIIEDISSSCNHVAVMDEGEAKFIGTPQDLVELTSGFVWEANVSEDTYERIRRTENIVHQMRTTAHVKVRILAKEKPVPDAVQVTPTLEDSYIWLLGKEKV
ncbi:MAG: efflux RND transporter permease subunit, partial [Candidatus Aminicenantes bacterium]|nr:efflux RND transporter permease subunit [Candidatus Aminicenantes bacterium]